MPSLPDISSRQFPALLVSELFPPAVGGSAVLFDNIYSRLADLPVEVLTDDALDGDRSPSGLHLHRRRIRTPWWGLARPRGLPHHLGNAAAVRRLALKLGPRTVVHCGRILPEGIAARLAHMAGGPPFLCWAHGEDLATALSSRELTWTTRWVLGGAAGALANSENTRAFLGRFDIAAGRVTVVHPGVDAQRFNPHVDGSGIRRRHALGDALVVLSVGRLQARKGHDVAIQAVARLIRDLPNLKYLIVGNGDERARLEQLVVAHDVADQVVFVGEISEDDLPRYYAACDIFLLPNRVERGDFEGFGIVFLEAAASARAVIGGASGGVVEAVADKSTGLLVDGANVEAVAGALRQLADSRDLRDRLGAAGRARAAGVFSWEAAADRVRVAHERAGQR